MLGPTPPLNPAADVIKRGLAVATRLKQVAAAVDKLAKPTNGTAKPEPAASVDPHSAAARTSQRLTRELKRPPTEIEVLKEQIRSVESVLQVRNGEQLELERLNTDLETRLERVQEAKARLETELAAEKEAVHPTPEHQRPGRILLLIAGGLFCLGSLAIMISAFHRAPNTPPTPRYRLTSNSAAYVGDSHFIGVALIPDADGIEMPVGIECKWNRTSTCSVATVTCVMQPNRVLKLIATVPIDHNPLQDTAGFIYEPSRHNK